MRHGRIGRMALLVPSQPRGVVFSASLSQPFTGWLLHLPSVITFPLWGFHLLLFKTLPVLLPEILSFLSICNSSNQNTSLTQAKAKTKLSRISQNALPTLSGTPHPNGNRQLLFIACNKSLKFLLNSKYGIYKFSNSLILDK